MKKINSLNNPILPNSTKPVFDPGANYIASLAKQVEHHLPLLKFESCFPYSPQMFFHPSLKINWGNINNKFAFYGKNHINFSDPNFFKKVLQLRMEQEFEIRKIERDNVLKYEKIIAEKRNFDLIEKIKIKDKEISKESNSQHEKIEQTTQSKLFDREKMIRFRFEKLINSEFVSMKHESLLDHNPQILAVHPHLQSSLNRNDTKEKNIYSENTNIKNETHIKLVQNLYRNEHEINASPEFYPAHHPENIFQKLLSGMINVQEVFNINQRITNQINSNKEYVRKLSPSDTINSTKLFQTSEVKASIDLNNQKNKKQAS